MKKSITLFVVVIMTVFALTACSYDTMQKKSVSRALGVDITQGEEVSNYDDYDLGEGRLCIAIKFDDDDVLTTIIDDGEWKKLPFDFVAQTLLYGWRDEVRRVKIGPFIQDQAGNPLVPQIQNGYYLLIDRQSDQRKNILERYSMNLTMGIYDLDTDILYCLKLDT